MPVDPKRVQAVFLAAVEIADPLGRSAVLDRECPDDIKLRQRVEELLRAHDESASFLEHPADREMTGPLVSALPPVSETTGSTGTLIGPYKLLQLLGEGGMGAVWVAEQEQPVKRHVALKLIKAGMGSSQVLRRFEAERQALALMDHANIAKVFDAGTTPQGRPYFAMELIKGIPITKFCDQEHLTPRERLELFIPVCQAVQHAHQKGIIHRDLKPSNVMIALYDGKPVPKVIDFGVAKATGQKLSEDTVFTEVGQIVGTMEYMAPEQAELNNLDIDSRADIYSLGVILYELLTGSAPFTARQLRGAAFTEMLRMIREIEPPKPSTRLSSSDELPSIAANRKLEPNRLTRLVRGELDWIAMKALEKDRNRRYETANGFAMDLQRYLANEPVQACPPSTVYRLKKFVRRNKGPVLAVSLVLLALLAGIIGTTWQAVRASNRAEGERLAKERAETNFALANEAVEKFLGTVTNAPELNQVDLNKLRKKLLESAFPFLQKIAAQNGDDPEVAAGRGRAYLRMAYLRLELGEHEAAIHDSEMARDVFGRLTNEFPAVTAYSNSLAISHNHRGTAQRHLGKFRESEVSNREAMVIQDKLAVDFPTVPEYRLALTNSCNDVAAVLVDQRKFEEAEGFFRRALDIREKLAAEFPAVPEYRNVLAQSHNNLGTLLHNLNKRAAEEEAYRQALAIQEKLVEEFPAVPEYRRDLAKHQHNLGKIFEESGERGKAEVAHRRVLAIFEKLATDFPTVPEYRQAVAKSHVTIAILLANLGKDHDAEAHHRHALVIGDKLAAEFPAVPGYRQELAHNQVYFGHLLTRLGKKSAAEPAYRQALAIQEKLAADFPAASEYRRELADSHNELAFVLRELGKRDEAESHYRQALGIREKLATDFPNAADLRHEVAKSHNNLGSLLHVQGKLPAAEAAFRRALQIHDKLAAEFPSIQGYRRDLAKHHTNLGNLLSGQGEINKAESAYRQALEIQERLFTEFPTVPEYRQSLASSYDGLGNLMNVRRNQPAAEAALRRALDIREKLIAEFPNVSVYGLELGGGYCNFGLLFRDFGQPEAALEWFQKAIARLNSILTAEPRLATARQFLRNSHWGRAHAFDMLGRHADAARDYERLLELDDGSSRIAIRSSLASSRLRGFRKDKDSAGCLKAAVEYDDLKRSDAGGLYDAACHRAICAAVIPEDPKTPSADAARLAREQADLAMVWLQKAVAAGYADAAHMTKDQDLDAVREREDFKKILAELQAKQKPPSVSGE